MNSFIGTKLINAKPMTKDEFERLKGDAGLLCQASGIHIDGYLVEYLDGGKANVPGFTGYVSWSPKDVFERSYRPCDGMSFGLAIDALKAGKRVAREGWNGKGMWLEYIEPQYAVDLPYIRMSYPVNSGVYPIGARVPWLASQTDMLCEDWCVVA